MCPMEEGGCSGCIIKPSKIEEADGQRKAGFLWHKGQQALINNYTSAPISKKKGQGQWQHHHHQREEGPIDYGGWQIEKGRFPRPSMTQRIVGSDICTTASAS